MMRQLFGVGAVSIVVAATTMASPDAQQTRQVPAALKPVSGWIKTSSYVPPKTPWGDPDIQGGYTNVNENGIPFEKPGNFATRQVEEIDDSELAELNRERNERALASRRASAVETPARGRCTGTSTTTRRTAAAGWSLIPRMDAFRRRPLRRCSGWAEVVGVARRQPHRRQRVQRVERVRRPPRVARVQQALRVPDVAALEKAAGRIRGSIAASTIGVSRVDSQGR